jgi:hypothetical protein
MENQPQPQPQHVFITQTAPPSNGLGTAAMVLGIISVVFVFIPILGLVAWITSPLALIFGLIGLGRAPKGGAITGVVTGCIGIAVCIMWVSALVAAASAGAH